MNCIICGKEISKRQSVAYTFDGQVGRACKTHPEAMEYAKLNNEEARKAVQSSVPERERILKQMEENIKREQDIIDTIKCSHEHCWVCGKNGMHVSQLARLQLIGMKLLDEIKVSYNLLFPQDNDPLVIFIRKYMKDKIIFRNFPKYAIKKSVLQDKFRPVFEIVDYVLCCPDCAKANKLDWNFDTPKISIEAAHMLGNVFEEMSLSDFIETEKKED